MVISRKGPAGVIKSVYSKTMGLKDRTCTNLKVVNQGLLHQYDTRGTEILNRSLIATEVPVGIF